MGRPWPIQKGRAARTQAVESSTTLCSPKHNPLECGVHCCTEFTGRQLGPAVVAAESGRIYQISRVIRNIAGEFRGFLVQSDTAGPPFS